MILLAIAVIILGWMVSIPWWIHQLAMLILGLYLAYLVVVFLISFWTE